MPNSDLPTDHERVQLLLDALRKVESQAELLEGATSATADQDAIGPEEFDEELHRLVFEISAVLQKLINTPSVERHARANSRLSDVAGHCAEAIDTFETRVLASDDPVQGEENEEFQEKIRLLRDEVYGRLQKHLRPLEEKASPVGSRLESTLATLAVTEESELPLPGMN